MRPVPVHSAKVVARVGDEVILAADVMPIVEAEFKALAQNYPPEHHEMLRNMLMIKHVKSAAETKLLVHDMKKGVDDKKWPEMEQQIMQHFEKFYLPDMRKKAKVKTDQELEAKMKAQGTTMKMQRKAFMEMVLVQEWMKKNTKTDEHVTHQQMLEYYHEHHADYEFPAKARFEQVRINYGKKRSKQEAWQIVCRLGNQIYSGASLAELAKAHSEGAHAEKGGQFDWTRKGSLSCDELDAVLFSLPVGALSNPIDDGRGFIIVRVLERTEAGATSFQDVQKAISDKIKAEREMESRSKAIAEFMDKAKSRVWTIYGDIFSQPPQPQTTRKRTPNNFLR